jgi:TldD protein
VSGIAVSNGHGRRQAGAEVVSRQSNLLVEASRTVSDARLKQLLVEEVKKQGRPFGYYFQEITGGFTITNTGRNSIQAFKVLPLVVYRIYPDGREELVRGVDIVGTPLASFNKIIAAGDKPDLFNGYCGAESGYVPVSAVSPALLVSEIEIARKESSRTRAPILPAPAMRGAL